MNDRNSFSRPLLIFLILLLLTLLLFQPPAAQGGSVSPAPAAVRHTEQAADASASAALRSPATPAPRAGPTPKPEPRSYAYIGNRNSRRFHTPDCPYLPAEKNRAYFSKRSQAVDRGYIPCQKCHP